MPLFGDYFFFELAGQSLYKSEMSSFAREIPDMVEVSDVDSADESARSRDSRLDFLGIS